MLIFKILILIIEINKKKLFLRLNLILNIDFISITGLFFRMIILY